MKDNKRGSVSLPRLVPQRVTLVMEESKRQKQSALEK
jgi:hypothetical protein